MYTRNTLNFKTDNVISYILLYTIYYVPSLFYKFNTIRIDRE